MGVTNSQLLDLVATTLKDLPKQTFENSMSRSSTSGWTTTIIPHLRM